MGKRTEEDEKEFLKWLLETGKITKEMYDKAMNATPEKKEYNSLRTKIGYCIVNGETEHLTEMETRLKELEKIIKQQKKDKKGE